MSRRWLVTIWALTCVLVLRLLTSAYTGSILVRLVDEYGIAAYAAAGFLGHMMASGVHYAIMLWDR